MFFSKVLLKFLVLTLGILSSSILMSSVAIFLINKVDESIGTIYIASLFFVSFSFASIKLVYLIFNKDTSKRITRVFFHLLFLLGILVLSYFIVRLLVGKTLLSFFLPLSSAIVFSKQKNMIILLDRFKDRSRIEGQIVIQGVLLKRYSLFLQAYPTCKLKVISDHLSKYRSKMYIRRFTSNDELYLKFSTINVLDNRGKSNTVNKVCDMVNRTDILSSCHLRVLSKEESIKYSKEKFVALNGDNIDIRIEYDQYYVFLKSLYILRRVGIMATDENQINLQGSPFFYMILCGHNDKVIVRSLSSPLVEFEKGQLELQIKLYSAKVNQNILKNLAYSGNNSSQKG